MSVVMGEQGKSSVRGFSLMEVLISLGIMALALLTLVSVLVMGLRAEDSSIQRDQARAIGNQILGRTLAELQNLTDLEEKEFWNQETASPGPTWRSGQETVDNRVFDYEVRSTSIQNLVTKEAFGESNGTEYNGLKQLKIKVSWDPGSSRQTDEASTLTVSRLINRRRR